MKTALYHAVLIASLFCIPALAAGQPSYHFQQDDSLLKQDLYQQSLQKKAVLLASVKKEHAKDYKRIYEDQFKEIGQLWQSSRTVTAREAHEYLQSVVRRLVQANEQFKGTDARVVFSRDWWPNACSMGEGTKAINAGLMIYLHNEAELAFVVGHELAHYTLGHTQLAISKYVETVNSPAYQAELKRLSKTQYRTNQQLDALAKTVVFNSRQHSRSNEAEADRQAFIFMRKAGYDVNAIRTCLQLLDKVDDTLLTPPLDLPRSFPSTIYPFKKKWIQAESAIFSQLGSGGEETSDKERDSLKTHPDCTRRIALLDDSMKAMGTVGASYLVDQKIFEQLKSDFLLEMTEQAYRDEELSRNLYYSLLLLQSGRQQDYAVYSVARCLNQIYVNQRDHRLGLTIDSEGKSYREDYNLLLRMLSRLRLEELASLNYYFCEGWKEKMRGNKGFEEEMKKAARQSNNN